MNRKKLKNIKKAIIDRDMKNREVARAAGMHEATLSLIINGAYIPSASQQEKLERILGKSSEELFE